MSVTQQYLCGELALQLARLECALSDQRSRCAAHRLRRDAECSPPPALGDIVRRALELADVLCWRALQKGDVATFADGATIAAELHEFATCARLLEE